MTLLVIAAGLLDSYNLPMTQHAFSEWASRYNPLLSDRTLKNRLKEIRIERGYSQAKLAELVGVSRNTISSIETGQFNPTAKLALILCIALDTKFEELFYF